MSMSRECQLMSYIIALENLLDTQIFSVEMTEGYKSQLKKYRDELRESFNGNKELMEHENTPRFKYHSSFK